MSYLHEVIQPDELLEVKLFDFKADSYERVIPPHWHASVELLYCIEGTLKIRKDNREFLLKQGDVMLLNSNVVHSTNSPRANHILVIQIPYRFMQRVTENAYNTTYIFDLNSVEQPVSSEISVIFKTLAAEISQVGLEARLGKKIKLYQLSLELIKYHQQRIDTNARLKTIEIQEKMLVIVDYIKKHFQEEMPLEHIAEKFNYSATYFSRFFKKNMGTTFSDYLTMIRIEHAQHLLTHSQWTILDISLASGFNHVRTFFAAFQKYHQMSPSDFRKKTR